MPIVLFNNSWMLFNIVLAILPIVFAYICIKSHNKFSTILFGALWLAFFPNTIYLFTDMIHILYQLPQAQGLEKFIIPLQFALLQVVGFVTFILGFRPFEHILEWLSLNATKKVWAIIAFNFVIAFGIVLGRVERVNSWDLVADVDKVVQAIVSILTTFELIGLTILFGLFCNFFYFLFRDSIYRSTVRLKKSWLK